MSNRPLSLLACFLFVTPPLFSQHLSVGFLGGLPLTNPTADNPNGYTIKPLKKAVFGATAEISLPKGLSIEGDFLFHQFSFDVGTNSPPGYTAQSHYHYATFEIPALLKARFTNGMLRPFVVAGPEFRGMLDNPKISHYGLAFGGGIEFGKRRFLRFDPQIRYTHWGSDNLFTTNGGKIAGEQANQLQVLIGVIF